MRTRHHRKPKKHGGTGEPDNISLVPDKKHKAWHMLFNHMTPYQIAKYINDVWLDPDYELVVQRRRPERDW